MAFLLGFNKTTVQQVLQLKNRQVRKRPIGMRPRIYVRPPVATAPNQRWSTNLCRIWAGENGCTSLALMIDCHTRERLGWHLSRTGTATTAASALEYALISRFGTLSRVTREFLLRSDNGLSLPAAITPRSGAAMAYDRSSSLRIVRSRTAWSSA